MSRNDTRSVPAGRPSSRAFARPRRKGPGLGHWLAALPLVAVACITFGGRAPAGMSSPESVAAAPDEMPGRWSIGNARDLISVIEESTEEGLNPADYNIDALHAAVAAKQKGPALDALATASALRIAHDYANGRIDDKAALGWYIDPPTDPNRIAAGLAEALDHGRLGSWLRGLLPDNEQYRALKAAYADARGDEALRGQLRANLERWRWMPRELGDRYIYVNVPSYRLSVISGGIEEASYNVVVGAPKTPTPQLQLYAQSVVANPGWTVPQSIIKAGGMRGKGFRWTRNADGSVSAWQAPGPSNALGRIKIDMPNPHAIYLHDTPNRAVFARQNRALSHGCIRVENIEELAAMLQGGDGLDEALADPRKTKVLQLERSVPVYLVYFTAQADPDGTVRSVGDPYGRDKALLAKLGAAMEGELQVAGR
ncbi:L,D-transpeptidase family protein [Sphingomonas histidinilytica]|jgi:murein L,D-transpeptidase YcbB/YkuD|uniref:L,D-transpeptidase catalytic domain n=1 Tax=Rhizorhabdus histidinilytica TaxID=439228 RepID=A0A1T5C1Y6_9SPHN|nr:L,D-transpeptidase family protein [Rhizorhabdus histidinilytica]MBO9375323.1 L,D-transpeptidase family protein [Rhizorhabdus histidinilytica]QEH77306.1 L,D-transpeptidase family protein [Sphingomonas sp. C8-2]SKB53416.1 L,D-transpeptidase catalytic domain [Rhizorhabdus histidinilytica]